MANYCFECHDSDSAEAEIDLEDLELGPIDPYHAARILESARHAIESEDMPPQKAGQPSVAERAEMLGWIKEQTDFLADTYEDDPGTVVMPRLTNYEYRNVIRDLTDGVVRDAGKYLPNEGGAGEGFANVGLAQGMTSTQLEKYLEAAKGALQHLTVTPADGMIWSEVAHPPLDSPTALRTHLIDQVIAWHVGQQQQWNAVHQQRLADNLGFSHAAYLEASWKYRYRRELGLEDAELNAFAQCEGEPLAPVALRKWWDILNDPSRDGALADWAAAWRTIPGPQNISKENVRLECIAITSGKRGGSLEVNEEDYAPPYEISFHEAKEEVLESARKEGIWPFRIDIGDAKELFLIMTDAGDGNRGEYGVWRRGRILFKDGRAENWEDVVTVLGANSGNTFPFGIDGEGAKNLPANAIGVRPPGALKFAVPDGASVFEVDLTLDENRVDKASIQALVLKQKPKSQSYVPNRYVFGGKARATDASNEENKQRARLLRRRNVAEANRTKIGLNAERNVFGNWNRTPLKDLGGPWPDQAADSADRNAPYHYTVDEVMENALPKDLEELETLLGRLKSVVQSEEQEAYRFAKRQGWSKAKEGVKVPAEISAKWSPDVRAEYERLAQQTQAKNDQNLQRALPWIESFARQAWRRSVSESERQLLISLYQDSRGRGYSFDSSVKAALMLVLNSPDFLYRLGAEVEAVAKEETSLIRLNDHQLANRLSFFLWASLPDEELLSLAESGKLSQSGILKEQVRRMLNDPKAHSLSVDFAGQLWNFAGFQAFDNPDGDAFPDFTNDLRGAMIEEVTMFLDDLFRNDRSLTALLEADYTFANGQLARHYEIEGVSGGEFRRVAIDPTQRGGLTGMGLFLTKTSLPLRTSPVQRGVWMLEQILGRELPSPPADVPDLSEEATNEEGLSILEQLEVHRAEPGCASCHDKIDPLGIAMENYDAIGRWRETKINSAVAHDGSELNGIEGLKDYLISNQKQVFAHFNRKLLGYALGRSVGPGDRKLLLQMDEALEANDYRLRPLLELIVTSPQFTLSRNPSAP